MSLTPIQQGQLIAFKTLRSTMQDILDRGDELNMEMVMDLLRVMIVFLEAYDEDESQL